MGISLPLIEKLTVTIRADPRAYFAVDGETKLKELKVMLHPDKHSGCSIAAKLFAEVGTLYDRSKLPAEVIKTRTHTYTLCRLHASGDTSDVHVAMCDGQQVLVKVSRVPGADVLIKHESDTLKSLESLAGTSYYSNLIPAIVDSFGDKRNSKHVNVFRYIDGGYTLAQLKACFPAGLDGRHVAWIYNRLLSVLGFCRLHRIVHNGVLPDNIIVYPATHELTLVDWKLASDGTCPKFTSSKWKEFYPPEITLKQSVLPSTDLYMATKCMQWLGNNLLPHRLNRFMSAATLESKRQRPQDPWEFKDQLAELLLKVYGPRKFVELVLPKSGN